MQYTKEFKDQAVRFVFESIEPTESRKEECQLVISKVNVKEVTLYNWVKAVTPVADKGSPGSTQPGSIDDLRGQVIG